MDASDPSMFFCFTQFHIHVMYIHVLLVKSGTIIPVDFHVLEWIAQQPFHLRMNHDLLERARASIDIWICCVPNSFTYNYAIYVSMVHHFTLLVFKTFIYPMMMSDFVPDFQIQQ